MAVRRPQSLRNCWTVTGCSRPARICWTRWRVWQAPDSEPGSGMEESSAATERAKAGPIESVGLEYGLGRRGAVFGGQSQLGAAPAHIKIGVTPAVEFT